MHVVRIGLVPIRSNIADRAVLLHHTGIASSPGILLGHGLCQYDAHGGVAVVARTSSEASIKPLFDERDGIRRVPCPRDVESHRRPHRIAGNELVAIAPGRAVNISRKSVAVDVELTVRSP